MTPPLPSEVDELVAEYLVAAERGQAPDPADWLARHPDHAAELAAFLADLGRFGAFLGMPGAPGGDLTVDYSPGAPAPAAPPARAGERFAEYELLGEPLGRGGMGVVYRARLAGTGLVVALKQILPGLAGEARRFREEVEAAAGLRHPNLVPIYHVGEAAGRPFFTMALMEGGSLDQHAARYRGDPRAAAGLVARVARAVHHAHQRQILHRDLKPSNILLDPAGEPHVADFGLAVRLTDAGAADAPSAGSLPWMAPEAVRGDPVTTAVDVWALGVILYELLTGVRPFAGADAYEVRQAILGRDPVPPRQADPRVPRDLEAICRRCLAKDPDRRYESASAVAIELERWLRDEPVRARPAGRGERFVRWCRRNPGVAGGAVAAGVLLLAATLGSASLAGELEDEMAAKACLNCEYEAGQVAGNVLRRFDRLCERVRAAADEINHPPPHPRPPAGRAATEDVLSRLVRTPLDRGGGQPFVNAFLLDPGGVIRTEFPPPRVSNPAGFPGRDYFVRAGRRGVHVSRVFRSETDGLDKLALSVALRPDPAGGDWVLAATVTTDERLDLGVVSMSDERHTAVLIAPRDTAPPRPGAAADPEEYVVLVHPALRPRTPSVRFGPGRPDFTGAAPFGPDRDFRDPLAARDPVYAGRWVTGSARVGDTEMVVVVQQRYDEAVGPHLSFFRRFLAWVGASLAAGLVAFVGFRSLRNRHAGPALPAP